MQAEIIEKRYPENIRTEVFRTLMEHPVEGVPRIHSVRLSGDEWIVREDRVFGITLAEYIAGRCLDKKEAVGICMQLCDILEKVHRMGIVHGDIKPENIMMDNSGRIWLIDFDASHFVKKEPGRDTVMMGTPGYASPEQYGFGRSDPRSDIYAIGVLLNVMLTGHHPLYGRTKGSISAVTDRCIRVDPDRRYQTVEDLKKALRRPVRENPAFPPGFRTLNPAKMLAAFLGYAFIIYFCFFFRDYNASLLLVEIWLFLMLTGTVFICSNYLGVQDLILRRFKWHRALVITAELVIWYLLLLIVIGIIFSILKSFGLQ